MSDLKLVVGDRNFSSWSLRPWLAMTVAGFEFETIDIALDRPDTRENIKKHSPTGLVPCLLHGDFAVWDSLAICEYAADLKPEARLWPEDMRARARARSISAEMHSGFQELRTVWPMDIVREDLEMPCRGRLERDVQRVGALWAGCRETFGADGPFLFGRFTVADAMFAPVVSRFKTYGPVDIPDTAQVYADALWALPAFAEWRRGAQREMAA